MDMSGWDTMFAATIAYTNEALLLSSEVLQSVQTVVNGALGSFTISAEFGPWQVITGGSGQLIHMVLPITSGSITPAEGTAASLNGCQPIMQFSLQLLSAGEDQNASQQIVLNIKEAGQLGAPGGPGIVNPIGFLGPVPLSSQLQPILLNGLATAIAANASRIGFALASINPVAPGSPSWLAPKNCGFLYFETGSPAVGYLAILSTAASSSNPEMVVDPSLVSGGLPAGYAISLPLYLSHVTLPAILLALPGAETQQFVVNTSPASLVLDDGQSVSLGSHQVGAITYHPEITSLSMTPGVGEMSISANGNCDLYGGCSMTFTAAAQNQFEFNAANQTCSFSADNNPSVQHSTSVPWWYLGGGVLAYAIADTVTVFVSQGVADLVGNEIAAGTLSSSPTQSVSFAGMKSFTATAVSLNGAVVIQTSTEPVGSKFDVPEGEKQYV